MLFPKQREKAFALSADSTLFLRLFTLLVNLLQAAHLWFIKLFDEFANEVRSLDDDGCGPAFPPWPTADTGIHWSAVMLCLHRSEFSGRTAGDWRFLIHTQMGSSYTHASLTSLLKRSLRRSPERPDAVIRVEHKDPGPPWPGRVFGSFVLLTNEQRVNPPLPGRLHQEVLSVPPPPEVELEEPHFLHLNLLSSSLNTWQELPPGTGATSFPPLSTTFVSIKNIFWRFFKSPIFPKIFIIFRNSRAYFKEILHFIKNNL